MKFIFTMSLVSLVVVNAGAANVHVRPRSSNDAPPQTESRGEDRGGSSSRPAPERPAAPETYSPARTTVRPRTEVRSADRRSDNSYRYRNHTDLRVAGRPHNARVSVVRSPHWRAGHSGRPYRYWRYRGHPWYGFYVGPRYYWSRWYADRWWWYDTHHARWSFWYGGYWWWTGPAGVTYVYINDTYSPYREGVVSVPPPVEVAAPPNDNGLPPPGDEPSTPAQEFTATSPDGKRMVQVVGPQAEAFLYDTSSGKSVFLMYLTRDVAKVRFEGGQNNAPLRILVDFKNDSFAWFDADGRQQGGNAIQLTPTHKSSSIPVPPAPLPSETQSR